VLCSASGFIDGVKVVAEWASKQAPIPSRVHRETGGSSPLFFGASSLASFEIVAIGGSLQVKASPDTIIEAWFQQAFTASELIAPFEPKRFQAMQASYGQQVPAYDDLKLFKVAAEKIVVCDLPMTDESRARVRSKLADVFEVEHVDFRRSLMYSGDAASTTLIIETYNMLKPPSVPMDGDKASSMTLPLLSLFQLVLQRLA
jgi:hypothetical protein